jgi:Leucine-rich repeat (LRR) protein
MLLVRLIILNNFIHSKQVIPDSIAELKMIVELDVSSNLLESLPDCIGLLTNLKFLNLSGNKLTALPESVSLCRFLFGFKNRISLDSILKFAADLFILFCCFY